MTRTFTFPPSIDKSFFLRQGASRALPHLPLDLLVLCLQPYGVPKLAKQDDASDGQARGGHPVKGAMP